MFKLWREMHKEMVRTKYTLNFKWLGFTINQLPQDMVALQQIIFDLRPEIIVETGVAYGGSVIFSASIQKLCGIEGKVIGIDKKILETTRRAIEKHPLGKNIILWESSSTEFELWEKISDIKSLKHKLLLILDSDHTHEHVLKELHLYSDLADYIIVNDTGLEDLPPTPIKRRWGKGNNPKTAVYEFLKENKDFEIDKEILNKIIITGHPDGYLKRVNYE